MDESAVEDKVTPDCTAVAPLYFLTDVPLVSHPISVYVSRRTSCSPDGHFLKGRCNWYRPILIVYSSGTPHSPRRMSGFPPFVSVRWLLRRLDGKCERFRRIPSFVVSDRFFPCLLQARSPVTLLSPSSPPSSSSHSNPFVLFKLTCVGKTENF